MTKNLAETNFAGGVESAKQHIDGLSAIASLAMREGSDIDNTLLAFIEIANKAAEVAMKLERKYSEIKPE